MALSEKDTAGFALWPLDRSSIWYKMKALC